MGLIRSILRDLKHQATRNGGLNKQKADEGSNLISSPFVLRPSSNNNNGISGQNHQQSLWANLPLELLLDILTRVEADETLWPARKAVVSCASVCKSWREATKEVVRVPQQCGLITFPISLKQTGPRGSPIQCFIRRERDTSTYRLYLGLSPALSGEASKFLLSAKKIRKTTKTDFVISLASNDFSQTSDTYVGKLRSNFFGSKFSVLDCRPPCCTSTTNKAAAGAHFQQSAMKRRISTKKVLPKPPLCNYNVATVSYELNVLRTRGPRRMHCTMHAIPISSIQENGKIPNYYDGQSDETLTPPSANKRKEESASIDGDSPPPLSLRNKTPRWHEQLQCWCLNFRGRVTVASVKNFQLVADFDPSSPNSSNVPASEQERVVLQFGKIGKDIFTMDYRYPLSAFQAFAICLSSFDTKPACE